MNSFWLIEIQKNSYKFKYSQICVHSYYFILGEPTVNPTGHRSQVTGTGIQGPFPS
jgi:hypothetical protein